MAAGAFFLRARWHGCWHYQPAPPPPPPDLPPPKPPNPPPKPPPDRPLHPPPNGPTPLDHPLQPGLPQRRMPRRGPPNPRLMKITAMIASHTSAPMGIGMGPRDCSLGTATPGSVTPRPCAIRPMMRAAPATRPGP